MRPSLSSIALLCLFALPLVAQEEALHGTWEGAATDSTTTRLTFGADGAFELNLVIQLGDAFSLPEAEAAGADLPALEVITIRGTGTYGVEGDSLWTRITESEMLANGENAMDVLTQLGRGVARLLADLSGVTDEDYPAFEQAFVDEFLGGFDEEAYLESNLDGRYAIEGDTLFVTRATEEGGVETLEFHRLDVASVVVGTSWGRLKAAWRP